MKHDIHNLKEWWRGVKAYCHFYQPVCIAQGIILTILTILTVVVITSVVIRFG